MAGTFSKSNRPVRPGAYVNYSGSKSEPVIVNPLGTVALPFAHSWGPENTPVVLSKWADFAANFTNGGTDTSVIDSDRGAPLFTDGYRAVKQAFRGEDYQGKQGAAQVIAYRLVPSDAAAATYAVQNATVTAFTLTAKYKGSYGSRLKIAVVPNAVTALRKDLVIYDNVTSVELERYTTADLTSHAVAYATDIPAMVAAINAKSQWVTASAVASATSALATVSTPASFTGGADGTVTATEWTNAMTALEPYRFFLFAANTTNSSILASIVTWAAGLNAKGKRFLTISGGGGSIVSGTATSVDDITAAQTRAAAINTSGANDPNFITLGVGIYLDSELGVLNTAQLAPRVAGILAERGEYNSLTFARLNGLSIKSGAPTEAQILTAIASGIVVIARDSNQVSPLRLEKAITTYTVTTDLNRPYSIYSVPKFLRIMHAVEMEITEWAEGNVIGRFPVTDATRNFVLAEMTKRLSARQASGVIQGGWTVSADASPAPTATDEFVALSYSLTFQRSLEQILNTIVVG